MSDQDRKQSSRRTFLRRTLFASGAAVSASILQACGSSSPAPSPAAGTATVANSAASQAAPTTAAQPAPTAAGVATPPAVTGSSVASSGQPTTLVSSGISKVTDTIGTVSATPPPVVAGQIPAQHAPLWQQEAAKPIRGGILPSVLGKDIENLLIMHYVNGPLRISTNFCYRRLVQYRAFGYHDLEVAPDMADSWEVKDGGKTYVFHLHPGIHWHNIPPVNGREFTSDDVAWTIKYYKTMDKEYSYLWDWVSSWETPDKYTIVLHTDKPNAEALQLMAVDNNVLIAKEVYDQDGSYKQRVIGTGPFIWDSWQPGVKVQVRKNPNYWEVSEIDGKPLPYLDGLDLFVIPDYAAQLAAFKAQRVNGNRWGFQPHVQDVDTLVKALPHTRRWDGIHFLSGDGVILNTTKAPWTDVRVRRAASMALNRDAMIHDIVQGHGKWEGFINYSFEGYAWPEEKVRSLPNLQYNPDMARQLIKDAGAQGATVLINTSAASGPAKVVVQTLQQAWKDIGLNATLDVTDIPTSYQKRVTGDFQVFGEGVGFSSGSLDAATRQLFNSKGERNYGKASDPTLDQLTEQQFTQLDEKERIATVDKIQQILHDQMFTIPHYVQVDTLLDQAWVMNKPWHWQLAWPYPERIWVDKSRNSS